MILLEVTYAFGVPIVPIGVAEKWIMGKPIVKRFH